MSVKKVFEQAAKTQSLQQYISQPQAKIHAKGFIGSALSFQIQALFKNSDQHFLLVFKDKEEAAYYLNDLENLISKEYVLFHPGSYRRPYQIEETDNANVLLRAEVLNRLNARKKPVVIVSYTDALFEKVVTRKQLDKNTLKIAVGEQITIDFVNEALFEYNFKRVDFVSEPGEFSVRGGIIDVFSFSNENPYRIEFFGNEIDSIRTFDVETQLSIETNKKITIIPNVENKLLEESRESFLNYINPHTVLFINNTLLVKDQLTKMYQKATETFKKLVENVKHLSPDEMFVPSTEFLLKINDFTVVELAQQNFFTPHFSVDFYIKPQPSFNK